jgi:hypothetical protein
MENDERATTRKTLFARVLNKGSLMVSFSRRVADRRQITHLHPPANKTVAIHERRLSLSAKPKNYLPVYAFSLRAIADAVRQSLSDTERSFATRHQAGIAIGRSLHGSAKLFLLAQTRTAN